MTAPSLRPVSDALDLDRLLAGTRDQDARRALHAAAVHALRVLDRVHADGVLPRVLVELLPDHDQAEGEYAHKGDWAIAIRLRLRPDEPHLALLHEIGHLLDHVGVGGNQYAFSSKRDPRFGAWRAAVRSTRAVRQLHDLLRLPGAGRAQCRYLLRLDELWARSYAQYVAAKSRDPLLLRELRRLRAEIPGMPYFPYHWDDDEFPPVFMAIDGLLRQLGWII